MLADDGEDYSDLLPPVDYPPEVAQVISKVLKAVSSIGGARVHAFGSAVNGFGDSKSDIDLVLEARKDALVAALGLGRTSGKELQAEVLRALQRDLKWAGFFIQERVLHAKVPILKLRLNRVECDLSCNNLLPLFNTRLLKLYAGLDPRVVSITHQVKDWAKGVDVHGAPWGHLSSYAFTLLVIFYMQVRGALPCLQRGAAENPRWYVEGEKRYNVAMFESERAERPGAEVSFHDWSQFMCYEFQWGSEVVSVRLGMRCKRSAFPELQVKPRSGVSWAEQKEMLHVEDPLDIARNLNCVLAPTHNCKLWCMLMDLAGPRWRRQWSSGRPPKDTEPAAASNTPIPIPNLKPASAPSGQESTILPDAKREPAKPYDKAAWSDAEIVPPPAPRLNRWN